MPGIEIRTLFFKITARFTRSVLKKVGYLLGIWLTGKHWYIPLPPQDCHTNQRRNISEKVRVYVVHSHSDVERSICR